MTERVYLVVVEAVYDHGVMFASRSLDAARAFCEEYAPDTDGHHDWRIDEIALDVPGEALPVNGGGQIRSGITLTKKAPA